MEPQSHTQPDTPYGSNVMPDLVDGEEAIPRCGRFPAGRRRTCAGVHTKKIRTLQIEKDQDLTEE